jgi:hypothetical protein
VDCRPLFRPTLGLRHVLRLAVETYGPNPVDVIPKDILEGATLAVPLDPLNQLSSVLSSTYTHADVTVVNRGGGTASDVTVSSSKFAADGEPFRLRPKEQRTVSLNTKPGEFGSEKDDLQLRWDAERSVNESLIRWLFGWRRMHLGGTQ